MRNFLLILTLFTVFWMSCNNPVVEEKDISPPGNIFVTIDKDNPVDQIVNIFCTATDNVGIQEVQLWINSDHYQNMVDSEIPYSFALNTSENNENGEPFFEEGIIYNIQLKVVDVNGNVSFSEPPIQIEVDNSNSAPIQPNITEVSYSNGKNTIRWEKNTESDFKEYILKKRDISNSSTWITILQTTNQNTIYYEDYDIDPFNSVEYILRVNDIFGYSSISDVESSLIEGLPLPVDVIDINYSIEELTVSWEISTANDFKSYTILHSFFNEGPFDTIAEYFNKNIQSHAINFDISNGFTPIVENWFKVMVTDTFELSVIGNSLTNEIDPAPQPVSIDSVFYSTQNMLLYWDLSIENDVVAYELIKNGTEQYAFVNDFSTNYIYVESPDLSEPIYFDIITWDYWGQSTANNEGFEIINHAPITPEILNIQFDPSILEIKWNKNTEFDFEYYTVYHSNFPNIETANIIQELTNNMDTVLTLPTINYGFENENYFWVEVTDYWNKTSISSVSNLFEYQGYETPESINLYSPYFPQDGLFQLKWSQSDNEDFSHYTVMKANNIEMNNAVEVIKYGEGDQLGYTQTESQYFNMGINETDNYYQLLITDDYDMFASSNVVRIWLDESEWISINPGEFTYGSQDQSVDISYLYEVQKYPVTNVQYIKYLRENLENINLIDLDNNWIINGIFNHETEGFMPGEIRDYFYFENSQLSYDGNDFVVNSGFENHPITGVSWFGSFEYAEYENARLPNDQEWEKVARGNLGFNYPWSTNTEDDVINELNANFSGSNDPWDNLYKATTPVGYYNGMNGTLNSPSYYGVYDMAGNIREWTSTYNGSGFYFIKGGAFNMLVSSVEHKSWEHEELEPHISRYNLGIRCIRD